MSFIDMLAHEESLKVYRDLKAVTDTAYEDGYKEAEAVLIAQLEEERRQKEEERRQKEELIIALSDTKTIEEIAKLLCTSTDFIKAVILKKRS
jgi:hypothetical protein